MSFFFFFFNQNSSADGNESHDVNANVFKLRNRSDVLELEAKLLVLRLLQLRDFNKTKISSVKQEGIELPKLKQLKNLDLTKIKVEEINKLSELAGYCFTCRVKDNSRVFSKVNIEINGLRYGIRCFDHTERPLINQ